MTSVIEEEMILGSKTAQSNENLVTIYRDNIRKFGFSGRTLLYSSNFLHDIKLAQYQRILPESLAKGDSLLDIGCGYGSLAKCLNESAAEYEYYGIDIVPEFIEEARSKYSREGVTFEVMDLENYQGQKDWCILLGVVNSVPEPKKLIEQAWNKSKKGLIVDFNNMHSGFSTQYNTFNIDEQKNWLKKQGAVTIEEYESEHIWKTFVVKK